MSAGRRALAAAPAAVIALLATGAALAATGEITPQFCIDDNDHAGGDACLVRANGLGGVVSAVASPDGRSLYTASVTDDAVVEFARRPSGELDFRGCTDDNDAALDECQETTNGLDGAFSIAISADGRNVYAAAFDDDAIVTLNRDPATGSLSPQDCIDDNDPGQGPDACSDQTDGLDGVSSVAVSPDGKSVYAASMNDDSVVRFERDTDTGALTPAGCVGDNDSGVDDCGQETNGLDGARSVAISPDSDSVYVASGSDDALARFSRDPQSGSFTPQGCIDDRDTGPDTCTQVSDGLEGARGVVVSPDGESVYVAAQIDNSIASFDRNPEGGALVQDGCIDDEDTGPDSCDNTAAGLDGVFSLTVSVDGLSVYAAAVDDDAVSAFGRDPDGGGLTPQGCIDDNDPPDGPDECESEADGLNGAVGVASSAGTTSLYVLSVYDEAVLWLVRQDETAPDTAITRRPRAKTKKRHAIFEFISSEPFSSFEPCPSPRAYGRGLLKPGKHTFRVRALDEPGNIDQTPARMRWKIRGGDRRRRGFLAD